MYPYQKAIVDAMLGATKKNGVFIYPGRRFGKSTVMRYVAATAAARCNGIRPNMVIIDEVTNPTGRLPVKAIRCNNVLTRQKVLSTRRGRRAKRRANFRKG
jgi:hypothetical protein